MSQRPCDLVLVKGAPGVGKSTAARLLARQFPKGALIEVDTLRGMVIEVNWKDQAEHRSVLRMAAHLATDFLRAGFSPVVLVDTFSGDKLAGFLDVFRPENPDARVFVATLHASEAVLQHRVLHREVGGFRDLAICLRINREVVRDAAPFETLIDTTERSPNEVAETIVAGMSVPAAPTGPVR